MVVSNQSPLAKDTLPDSVNHVLLLRLDTLPDSVNHVLLLRLDTLPDSVKHVLLLRCLGAKYLDTKILEYYSI
jgi:hypothetical protein